MRSELTKLSSFLKKSGYHRKAAVVRNLIKKYAAPEGQWESVVRLTPANLEAIASQGGDYPGVTPADADTYFGWEATDDEPAKKRKMLAKTGHWLFRKSDGATPPVYTYVTAGDGSTWTGTDPAGPWTRGNVDATLRSELSAWDREHRRPARQQRQTNSGAIKDIQRSIMAYGLGQGISEEVLKGAMNYSGDPDGEWGGGMTGLFANVKATIPTASDAAAGAMAGASDGSNLQAAADAVTMLTQPVASATRPASLGAPAEVTYSDQDTAAYLMADGYQDGKFKGYNSASGPHQAAVDVVLAALQDDGAYFPHISLIHAEMREARWPAQERSVQLGAPVPEEESQEGNVVSGNIEGITSVLDLMASQSLRLVGLDQNSKEDTIMIPSRVSRKLRAHWAGLDAEAKATRAQEVAQSIGSANRMLQHDQLSPPATGNLQLAQQMALVFFALLRATNDPNIREIPRNISNFLPGTLIAAPTNAAARALFQANNQAAPDATDTPVAPAT